MLRKRTLFITVVLLITGIYRFHSAFTAAYQTTAFPGDAWANIGGIFDVYQSVLIRGISSTFSDIFTSATSWAGNNTLGAPINFFWQISYFFLSSFFEPNNVYDVIGYIGWILIGLSTFILGEALGFNFLINCLFITAILSIENFTSRMSMHLGLAVFFMPIIVCSTSISFSENPNRKNILLLATALWFNFIVNEYFGYFGCFAVIALVIPGLLLNGVEYTKKNFWLNTAYGVSFFILIMCIFYPNAISLRIFEKLAGVDSVFNNFFHHDASNFGTYTTSDLYASFSPRFYNSFEFLNITKDLVHGENTFGIGSATPLLSILLVPLILMFSYFKEKNNKINYLLNRYIMMLILAITGIALSIKPDHPLSLSWIAQNYAPVFRVGIRSLLLTNIAVISMFFLGLQMAYNIFYYKNKKTSFHNSILASSLICLSFICIIDISNGFQTLSPLHTSNLGERSEYQELKNLPKGLLLEIPFHIPGADYPELDYPYYTAKLMHKKPIFNGGVPHKGNFYATLRRLGLFHHLKNFDQEALDFIREAHIKYITFHKKSFDVNRIKDLKGITEITNNDKLLIVSVDGVEDFDLNKTRSAIWPKFFVIPISHMHILSGSVEKSPLNSKKFVAKAHRPNGEHAISIFGPYLPLEKGLYRVQVPILASTIGPLDTDVAIVEISGPNIIGSHQKIIKNKDISVDKFSTFIFEFTTKSTTELEVKIHTLSSLPIMMGEPTVERPSLDLSTPYRIGLM